MTEQVADGNPGAADAGAQGSSFLSTLGTGEPQATASTQAPDLTTATGTVEAVLDGPPEGVPEKFWDHETKSIRVKEMTQAYTNLEKLIGHEKVPVPQSDDDSEGWDRWYKASGRPETPEDYGFEAPTLPEGMPYDDDLEKAFRGSVHAAGLNAKQANAIYDQFVKVQSERHVAWLDAQNQMKAKLTSDLQRKYGGEYPAKLTKAGTVMDKYGTPEFRQYLNETGLGNDPRMLDVLIRMGEEMGGETRLQGKPPQPEANPQDIQAAISKFRERNSKALHDKAHPDHDRSVKELNRLYQTLYPEKSA